MLVLLNIDNNEANKTENENTYEIIESGMSDEPIEFGDGNVQNVANFGENDFLSSVAEVVSFLSTNSSANSSHNQGRFSSVFSQRDKTVEEKINEANERIRKELLKIYAEEERLRQKRQKPIMISVMVLLFVQLVCFNVLMFILVLDSAKTIEIEVFRLLLDFLKYYIGAVVVELIGLIVTITANTFSSHLSKNISKILFDKKQ